MAWYVIAMVAVATVVFLTAFFSIKKFLNSERDKRLLDLKFESKKLVTPLRIQAYERLALFLERIEPNQLLLRLNDPELSADQLKTLMVTSIRAEYDHNLSQQIFVSSAVWNAIVQAKEETIKLINLCAGKLNDEATAIDLASLVLEQVADKSPIEKAKEMMKDEVRLLY
ncbi:hypothetical protein LJC68_02220 [Bacteroidales bacterium OttesenSCG-928-B11]|nr:hypothetical protein [Bacteroidales bacterium OttesenSCG-928-E04]MDL2307962.1 hypothetical protein [Bacteroidales bacterium OttesenSCG-928-C03]MDL2311677.1 hypothetical protein [Bacteroidales bacterium OttesenSCG-928-B11]